MAAGTAVPAAAAPPSAAKARTTASGSATPAGATRAWYGRSPARPAWRDAPGAPATAHCGSAAAAAASSLKIVAMAAGAAATAATVITALPAAATTNAATPVPGIPGRVARYWSSSCPAAPARKGAVGVTATAACGSATVAGHASACGSGRTADASQQPAWDIGPARAARHQGAGGSGTGRVRSKTTRKRRPSGRVSS